MRVLLAGLLALSCVAGIEDPCEIVRKSLSEDAANAVRARDYTYIERVHYQELDGNGQVKSTRERAHEVLILYGRPYRRLVERNGKPLSPEEAKLEDEKLSRMMEERRNETPDQRAKRQAEYNRSVERQRVFVHEIPDAFNFRLLGEETRDGAACYVIEAVPRPGFQPHDSRARILQKLGGKLWIAKADYAWVRVEAEAIENIYFGIFLARVDKGSRIEIDQTKVNGEIWMPLRAFVAFSARLALFKRLAGREEIQYGNYRKFQADSHIVSASGAKPN